MATEVITKIVVFDEKLYHAHGLVGQWCARITDRFGREAKRYAPVRSGNLRAGIFASSHQVGIRQVQGIIESTSPHTQYVLKGTTGPIMTDAAWANPSGAYQTRIIYKPSDGKWTFDPIPSVEGEPIRVAQRGYWMPIPEHGGHKAFYAFQVRGQRANNFLLKAWAATARDHTAIRGVSIPASIR